MSYQKHYSKIGYWQDYYKNHENVDYDWYLNYEDLIDMFRMLRNEEGMKDQRVLDVGCGQSKVLENLYKLGYEHLIGIDYCKEVIQRQSQKYSNIADNIQFFQMDALETDFHKRQFNLIFDKGTLDCILVSQKEWLEFQFERNLIYQ